MGSGWAYHIHLMQEKGIVVGALGNGNSCKFRKATFTLLQLCLAPWGPQVVLAQCSWPLRVSGTQTSPALVFSRIEQYLISPPASFYILRLKPFPPVLSRDPSCRMTPDRKDLASDLWPDPGTSRPREVPRPRSTARFPCPCLTRASQEQAHLDTLPPSNWPRT